MKRILSLGRKELTSGLNAGGFYNEHGGLWAIAPGLNPFINGNGTSGVLAGSSAATDITSGVVTDNIWAAASRVTGSNAGTIYLYGDGGKVYTIDNSGDNNPVYASKTVSNPANGFEIYKCGTTERLYYFQLTQIGTYDFAATWTDNWTTSLQSTTHHPTHTFLDRLYFGNGYYVGHIYSNAGTPAANITALNLPTDYTVTCIADDGQYLVFGATKNKDTSSSPAGLYAGTKIVFWDTFSSSWQKEYNLPSASINALKRVGSTVYAFCPEGVYGFNFGAYPVLLRETTNTSNIRFGYPSATDQYGDGVMFGNSLLTIGKPASYAQRGVYQPFAKSGSSDISFVYNNPRINRLLVGDLGAKLYRYTTNTNGAPSQTWYTKMLDLSARWKIQQIEMIFAYNALGASDSITVAVLDEDFASNSFVIASNANFGAVTRCKLTPSAQKAPELETMALALTITGGTPAIAKINIYGEEVLST